MENNSLQKFFKTKKNVDFCDKTFLKTQELLAKCKQNIVIYEKAQSAVKNIQLLEVFRLNMIKRRNDLVNYKVQLNFFISKFSNYSKHLLMDFFFKCNEKILLFDLEISNIY